MVRMTIAAKRWLIPPPAVIRVAVLAAFLAAAGVTQKRAFTEWNEYAGSASGMQYSALRQIDKGNVNRLRQAWFYPVPGTSARFGYNPLIMDGVMYVLGEDDALVALDAATGRKIWTHRAEGRPTDRGINYWESKDRSDRRLIFAADSYLAGNQRQDRSCHPFIRKRRPRESAGRIGTRSEDHSADPVRHAGACVREHDHSRVGDQ